MTVRRLRSMQRGPSCSYCAERAVWRGVYFTRYACEGHKPQLVHADRQQAIADDHFHNDRQFAR